MATLTVNVTLGNDSVSNAQLENMAEGTIKGRADGAGTGDPTDLTPDQASTILDAATDPFVRTSNLPSGGGDVVGPASSTDDNVPQWDGATGKLLKDGKATSIGGNGTADALKIALFTSTGSLQADVTNGAGLRGISLEDDGVHGTSTNGSAFYGNVTGAGAIGLRLTHAGASGEFIRCWNGGADQQFVVDRDGAISWPNGGTGPQTTRNNVLPSKTGNALKVLRVNGAESDYELADGVVDGGTLSIGLTFPSAGLKIADQNADHTLVLVPYENLTADRQLSIEVNDANRTIDLAGDLTVSANATVSGTNTGDQDLSGYVQDGATLSTGLTFPYNGLGILDGAADHVLRLQTGEDLTADRRIVFEVNDVNRTIALSGDLTVSAAASVQGTNTGDQDLSGLMVKASNLSDVSNTGTARDNLGIITRKVSTATTGVGASYTDVTDLSFMVVAGTTYHINVWILAECSNTGGGVCLSANGPAFTYFAARYEGNQTAGGSIIRSDVTAYDSLGSLAEANSVSAANTPYIFQLQAVLVPSANGTFVARVKRGGGAGNVAVRAGMIVAHAM